MGLYRYFAALTCLFVSLKASAQAEKFFAEMEALTSRYSIAELIPKLPKDMQRNVVVMLESRSIQPAGKVRGPNMDCSHPRFILFSDDGTKVIAFNSDPSKEGFEALEMRFFDMTSARFFFKEAISPKDLRARQDYLETTFAKEPAKLLVALRNLQDRANREGPNPPVCMACHDRKNPRKDDRDPLDRFDSYPTWRGALGEKRDVISTRFDATVANSDRLSLCYSEFKKTWITSKNPRFQNLWAIAPMLDGSVDGKPLNTNNTKYTTTVFPLVFMRARRLIDSLATGPQIKLEFFQTLHCDGDTFSPDRGSKNFRDVLKKHSLEIENFFSIDENPKVAPNDGNGLSGFFYYLMVEDPRFKPYFDLRRQRETLEPDDETEIARPFTAPTYTAKFNANAANLCKMKSPPPIPTKTKTALGTN